jgi:hypothetical protein
MWKCWKHSHPGRVSLSFQVSEVLVETITFRWIWSTYSIKC